MKFPDSYRQQMDRGKPPVNDKDFWDDPDKTSHPGLLLSDRIMFYCKKVNLIWPYDEQYVEPASYTLHAGNEYLIAVRPGQVESRNLEKEGKVVIPRNALIYIRFLEEVNIPHYMIARFNLRVTQVYRGLLLGTGPQVEPGYMGLLGCPIHNFTDEDKTIEFFEGLVTIDFEKTTVLGETFFKETNSSGLTANQYTGMKAGAIKVGGLEGWQCKIFNKRINVPFQSFLPPAQSVRSSVSHLQEQVENVDRLQKVSFWTAAGVGLAVFLVAITVYLHIEGYFRELKDDIKEINLEVGRLQGATKFGTSNAVYATSSKSSEESPPPSTQTSPIGKPPAEPGKRAH